MCPYEGVRVHTILLSCFPARGMTGSQRYPLRHATTCPTQQLHLSILRSSYTWSQHTHVSHEANGCPDKAFKCIAACSVAWFSPNINSVPHHPGRNSARHKLVTHSKVSSIFCRSHTLELRLTIYLVGQRIGCWHSASASACPPSNARHEMR